MNQFSPPEDPGLTQRTLIAFALILLLIVAAQRFLPRLAPPPASRPEPTQARTPPPAAPESAPAPVLPAAPSRGGTAASQETETVVENDFVRVVMTNRGAQAKSWILKKYNDDKGKPLELVHPMAGPRYGYPLSFWVPSEEIRDRLNHALYVVHTEDQKLEGTSVRSVSFEYADGSLRARKVFRLALNPGAPKGRVPAEAYVSTLEVSVFQNGTPVNAAAGWPAGFGDQTVPASYASANVVYRTPSGVERVAASKISAGTAIEQPIAWGGANDQYFAAVFLPQAPENAVLTLLRNKIPLPKNLDKPDPNQTVDVDVVGAAIGDKSGVFRGRLFVGPKALEVLDQIHAVSSGGPGPDLEPLVDFGKFFGWLAKPLFIWLEWTHDHLYANWGWSIVILTVVINVALLPLRITSMKSMMRMQKIQPQMKALQEKYKKYSLKDPRRAEMNKEMAALYKKENVNPMGGCLPMLLQWPFLVAFYSMLGIAIELRHARWLWIHDLASSDPYYILPILTVVGMFIVQKMTPQTTGDPMQQKMMLIFMPVMFGWISHALAAGLVLYWVWSNVVAIVQQIWLNHTEFGKEMRAAAIRRAAKPRRS